MTFSAVRTTGVYCREGCGGRPHPENVRPVALAAAAEAAGFRACHRCRPYRESEPQRWTIGPELVCRAVQLVVGGLLDSAGEDALASRVGVSSRHLRRLFETHVGATPDELARSRRAHFARRLLDDTDLPVGEVAFAAGFGSIRQMNRAMHEIFGGTPRELRARRRRADRLVADGGLDLRVPFRGPLDFDAMLSFFASRAIPGVEHVEAGVYRRTIVVEGHPGVIEVRRGGEDHLVVRAHLPRWDGLIHLVTQVRRLFDLDADLAPIDVALDRDEVLASRAPGLRVPGCWDPFETGVRAILGQQVSVRAASTIAGRVVEAHGTRVPGLEALGLTATFPDASVLAAADLSGVGMPSGRARTVARFAGAVASHTLSLGSARGLDALVAELTSVEGIGEWTANYLALRLGERDAMPASDLGLRRALGASSTADVLRRSAAWRPWRAYATVRLWRSLSPPPART